MWTWLFPFVQNICLKDCGRKQLVKSKTLASSVTHSAQIKFICISKMCEFYSKPAIEMEMVLGEQPFPNQWSCGAESRGMKQSLTLNPNLDFSAGDPRCKFPKVNGINATCLPGLTNYQGRGTQSCQSWLESQKTGLPLEGMKQKLQNSNCRPRSQT